MKVDARAALAALALILSSCQGSGFDSGMGGMEPPVSQPGSMTGNMGGISGGNTNNQIAGPNIGPNGQEELTNPGATLAPNEAQYPIGQGPSGMQCPRVAEYNQEYTCTLAFNMPTPSPSPSGSPGASAAKPTASPTPTPKPTASSDDSDTADDSPTPTPTPAGTLTLQVEPLPHDAPAMTRPDPLFMHITPLVAVRLQSNMDFKIDGAASMQYVLPPEQFTGRVFALQLYNESSLRGKRIDTLIASYQKFTLPQSNTVQFEFIVPQATVRRTQIWLLALYGAQVPPGTTPSPPPASSPSPSPSGSP